jgi:alginate O-acetyltransferase complex protein AlgI
MLRAPGRMVFSSHIFLFYFLPLALVLYYACPGRLRHLMLTLISYVFYGWANPLFTVLMLVSTAIDYLCGLALAWDPEARRLRDDRLLPEGGPRRLAQRVAVVLSVVSNLALLGFFKYFNFGVESFNAAAQALGLGGIAVAFHVVLPLGISFYTFQSMSYAIDVYRGHARPLLNPVDFACYVAMFPQLVAGPIIRFSEVADQLRSRTHTLEKFARGVAFFSLGMAKKILLANPCGKVADTVFDAHAADALASWLGVVAYSLQIYFDFSAYSDMAIGLGLMTGFVFPKNFDSPYRSASITEFWRRWHISLSSWLRDYLYIPLGGNRRGPLRTYVNLLTVMILGGLWHGASWNFVIWGAIHGLMLAMERLFARRHLLAWVPWVVRVIFTYTVVLITWVFFRAPNLDRALEYLRDLFGFGLGHARQDLLHGLIQQPYYLGLVAVAALFAFFGTQSWDYTRRITPGKVVVLLVLLLLSVVAMTTQSYNPFIYFIF